MRIRTVIFGTYSIASAVGLAVLMRFVLAEVRPRYVSSLERTMQESAHLVAAALATRSSEDWAEVFTEMSHSPIGIRLQIENAQAQLLFDSQPGMPDRIAEEYSRKAFRSAKEDVSYLIDRQPFADEGWLRVTASIIDDSGMRGRVVLSRPLRTVNAFIWSERKKLAGGALLVALVMLGLGWWIANRLTRSLERLAAYAIAVRDGRPATPPPSRATEVEKVGEAFEGMRRALEGKDYVEHYTHNLAHELKAPLSAIRGSAELLQEHSMSDPDRARFLGNLRAEADRLHSIVDRMLRLTALESKPGLEQREPIVLKDVVTEVMNTMEPEARGHEVLLRWTSLDEEARVSGERFLIHQAVMNLVQNALSFTPAGGEVRVAVTCDATEAQVVVEDTGPGLPDFAQDKVFDRFFSLPRPGSGRKSTGLGLSFVREIMHLHGGTATLVNRDEGGARATLRLPRLLE